jgi:hypothetical protein
MHLIFSSISVAHARCLLTTVRRPTHSILLPCGSHLRVRVRVRVFVQLVRNAISSGYAKRKDTNEIQAQVSDIIRSTPRTVFQTAALQQMLVQCVRHGITEVCGDILRSFAGSSRPLSVKESAQILLALPQCHGIKPVEAANLVDHLTEFTNFGQLPAEAYAAETYFRSRMR